MKTDLFMQTPPLRTFDAFSKSFKGSLRHCSQSLPGGFTLLELLVVATVIGILAAMMVPALAAFREKSQQTKCVNSAKQIGAALFLYADDSHGVMPLCWGWASLGGKEGGYSEVGQHRLMINKPLYKYQSDPELFRCPADRGDEIAVKNIGYIVTNCYAQYGTSYMAPWGYDRMGIRHVYGDAASPRSVYLGESMTQSDIALSPANKIMLGDWIYHPDRQVGSAKSLWHSYKGKSTLIMLFGDGHAQNWSCPPVIPQLADQVDRPPDPTSAYW